MADLSPAGPGLGDERVTYRSLLASLPRRLRNRQIREQRTPLVWKEAPDSPPGRARAWLPPALGGVHQPPRHDNLENRSRKSVQPQSLPCEGSRMASLPRRGLIRVRHAGVSSEVSPNRRRCGGPAGAKFGE